MSIVKNRVYDIGIYASAAIAVLFGVMAILSPMLHLNQSTWIVSASISGVFFLGLIISRSVALDKTGAELFEELDVKHRAVSILGALLVFSAVIAGCAMPIVKISSYLLSIVMGMFA